MDNLGVLLKLNPPLQFSGLAVELMSSWVTSDDTEINEGTGRSTGPTRHVNVKTLETASLTLNLGSRARYHQA